MIWFIDDHPTFSGTRGSIASLVIHRRNQAPLIIRRIVSLRRVLSHMTIKATHRVNVVVKHRDAYVATLGIHR